MYDGQADPLMRYLAAPLFAVLLVSLAAQDNELQDRYFGQIFTAMGLSHSAAVADIASTVANMPVIALFMEGLPCRLPHCLRL